MISIQRRVPVIEEVLISSDSSDDEVVILTDDEDSRVNRNTMELSHAIDYDSPSNKVQYNNGDLEFLHQLLANEDLQRLDQVYAEDDYEISKSSNSSDNQIINETNVNLKRNETAADNSVNNESNDKGTDTDDDQFYIAEECIEKDVSDNDEEMNTDTDADNLVVDLSVRREKKRTSNKLTNEEQNHEDLSIDSSSEDYELKDAGDDSQVITVLTPASKSIRIRAKRFLQMYCANCYLDIKCVRVYNNYSSAICRLCGDSMDFKCKGCGSTFREYSKAMIHLKQHCQSHLFWRCPECSYTVGNQAKLEVHIRRVHIEPVTRLQCSYCRKMMRTQKILERHVEKTCSKARARQPRYRCEMCSYKSRLLSSVRTHVAVIHLRGDGGGFRKIAREKMKRIDNTPIPAPVPDIANNSNVNIESKIREEKSSLESSIKLHCSKCKLTFKKTVDKGTKCKKCEGPLLWQCTKCKERSKSLCGIYDHLKNNCEFSVCGKCSYRFKSTIDAIEHKEICEKKNIKCKFCKYRTRNIVYLKQHLAKNHNNENVTVEKCT